MRGILPSTLLLLLAAALPVAAAPKSALLQACRDGNIAVAAKLLRERPGAYAWLDERGASGKTALMAAAERGHAKIAEALLYAGANCELQSPAQQTARQLAERNGHKEVVEMLVFHESTLPGAIVG